MTRTIARGKGCRRCRDCRMRSEGVKGVWRVLLAYKNGNDFGNVDAAADCSQVSIVFGNFLGE